MNSSITRAGHIQFRVPRLGRAREFYVDVLGFIEVDQDAERLYLGGLEEREHHGLVLKRADSPGVTHLAFRVSDPEALDRRGGPYEKNGCPRRRGPGGWGRG